MNHVKKLLLSALVACMGLTSCSDEVSTLIKKAECGDALARLGQ